MFQGIVLWWSHLKNQGIASVTENGQNRRYFLLLSRITSAPDEILPGYYVKFDSSLIPRRPGLLPVAVNVTISKTPFVDAGADALAGGTN